MLVATAEESGHWRDALKVLDAEPVWVFPYFGLTDAVRAET